jgi:tetratricopeptide (TPR) repeat protein
MSAVESAGPFRIGERVGNSVWKAQDTRSGKTVAIKILTKQLPKDSAKRDGMIRDMRVSAALYHQFLVPIQEVLPVNDNLLLVMDFLDAQSISKQLKGQPLGRADFFRLAYQLADAVRFLQTKGMVHGNINGDSVMVTAAGQIRLGGLNMINLHPRPEVPAALYQQKSADARSVAYMAPEQITGTGADARVDIWSLGAVMYEMATARLPYQATTAPDLARAIVDGNPISPKTANPSIDNAVVGVIGRCLFKDQYRRQKEAKAVVEDIARADPDAARGAADLTAKPTAQTASAGGSATREAILFVADVANYDQVAASDPAAAAKAAARMQQLLGEAVYLFDGQVVDPFGRKLVAELPSVESALEAARKGEFDFSPDQQGEPRIPVRMLLHAGRVTTADGAVVGDAVTKAESALAQLPPLKLHLSEDFMRRAGKAVRVRDAGARGGVKLYTIVPAEPPPPPQSAAEVEEEEPDVVTEELAPPRSRVPLFAGVAVVVAIVGIGLGWYFLRSPKTAPASVVTNPSQPAPVVVETRKVLIAPITIEGGDPALTGRATAIRMAAIEILRATPGVDLAESEGPNVVAFAGVMRPGAAGPELVANGGAPAVVPDAASGIRAILDWVKTQNAAAARAGSNSPAALNAYSDAVALAAAREVARAEAAIRTAIAADPSFLAAQVLALRHFTAVGKREDAMAAARQVVALDPSNIDAARTLARLSLAGGEIQPAFAAFSVILRKNPQDIEALTHIARYAASVGDADRFRKALGRMSALPTAVVRVHAPDLLVGTGQMEKAVEQYYEIETNVPDNPALSLKIGKIAVLRRSLPIAELELKKLARGDRDYGYHLLKAYIAASQGQTEAAEQELDLAAGASVPGDDFWTSAAEVYVMAGQPARVIEALDKAVARKEPTAGYILTNPLFAYLRSEESFRTLRGAINAQQAEVRSALAQLAL